MVCSLGFSQDPFNKTLSPDGIFEKIYDSYGTQYNLANIMINNPATAVANRAVLQGCSTNSIFNLYFEPDSGMSNTTNPVEMSRREVLCQVFQDISNFLTTASSPIVLNNTKINIWVLNINNVGASLPVGARGFGSAFYVTPDETQVYPAGIIDNEIWRTIHTGRDSYFNVQVPLFNGSVPTNTPGSFYHGAVAFNFNLNAAGTAPLIDWYTTPLNAAAPNNKFDFYSEVLKQVTRTLGITSFISASGNSFLPNLGIYARYDKFLKNNAATQSLLVNAGATTSSMYNYNFNPVLNSTILRPNCTLINFINTGPQVNNTLAAAALKYVGNNGNIMPVYTPTCFENFLSLSHFEDQLVPPNINDGYYALSNNQLNTAPNNTKRYLKPEERNVLCDLGYAVNDTFGSAGNALTSNLSAPYNYGSGSACAGITVAGTNDGIDPLNLTYNFYGLVNTNIAVNCGLLLANDTFPSGASSLRGLEYLQDLTTGVMLLTAGNSTSIATINSSVTGIHLLRYVPTYGSQKGNITYCYVYVISLNSSCPQIASCNLISNGGFEQNDLPIYGPNTIDRACGWAKLNRVGAGYIGGNIVPCNFAGIQTTNAGVGSAYAGIACRTFINNDTPVARQLCTKLATPLVAGTTYQLSYDISLAEKYSSFGYKLQAYFSNTLLSPVVNPTYLLPANNVTTTLIDPIVCFNNSSWDKVTFNYTATGLEKYLYLGALQPQAMVANSGAVPVNASCPGAISNNASQPTSYYYIDNVNLVAGGFNMPDVLCGTTTINNLAVYLAAGTPTNGVFSGIGVTLNSTTGFYKLQFTGSITSATVTYSYTNTSTGCVIILQDTITRQLTTGPTPTFTLPSYVCSGSYPSPLPTTSNNGITGIWSPAFSNVLTNAYNFTPNGALCPTNNVLVNVIPATTQVAVNDSFTVNYPTAAITTATVRANDTTNGNLITASNAGSMVVVPNVALNPIFTVGGITINPSGTITILQDTPAGTYTLYYNITKTCSPTSNQGVVTVVINQFFNVCPKMTFPGFCFNPTTAQTSDYATGSIYTIGGFANTFCGVPPTAGGLPATASNTTIVPVTPYPTGIIVNNNGTVTIPVGYLGAPRIYFKLCSGPICSNTVEGIILSFHVIVPTFDFMSFNRNSGAYAGGNTNQNVLTNDYLENCNSSWSTTPAILGTNCSLLTTTTCPAFYIDSTGLVKAISTPISPGAYQLAYKLTDTATGDFQTRTVDINVNSSRQAASTSSTTTNTNKDNTTEYLALDDNLSVVPNPSNGQFTILFNNNKNEESIISIYNYIGQKVIADLKTFDSQININLESYPAGNYLVKVATAGSILTSKIVIK